MNDKDISHLQATMKHINRVRDNCGLLADKLIKNGEFEIAKNLLVVSLNHDMSKIHNEVEWTYLRDEFKGKTEFDLALKSHLSSNPHHPEFWGKNINEMPRVYIYEMVSDWKARSEEFGTDLREWIKNTALEKYHISPQGRVYKEIKHALDLLLDKPFK